MTRQRTVLLLLAAAGLAGAAVGWLGWNVWPSSSHHTPVAGVTATEQGEPTAIPPDPVKSQQPSWASNELFMAARGGDVAKVKELLDQHPEQIDRLVGGMRATPLHIAAYRGRAEVVAELLRRNAKVNLRTKAGHTPLYDCIDAEGTPEIATMLLAHGADATLADYAGRSPLQLAIEKGRSDLATILQQHGARK